jgi:hypothetical protein
VRWPFGRRRQELPETASDTVRVLSILTPEQCAPQGVPGLAIQGAFTDADCTLAGFKPNLDFVNFMHQVIRTAGPLDPGIRQAAAEQENGFLYVIDLRTPDGPHANVPWEDIIGWFKVEKAQLVPGSYEPNQDHRILTENGPVQLPPTLRQVLINALLEHARTHIGGTAAQ